MPLMSLGDRLVSILTRCLLLCAVLGFSRQVLSAESKTSLDRPVPTECANLWANQTAAREQSETQERICLNDLWQFYPVFQGDSEERPAAGAGWGFFKVPGMWPPGNSSQKFFFSDAVEKRIKLEKLKLADLDQAWYRRDIEIPADWKSRRIEINFTSMQTFAEVWIDGKPAGQILWPGGVVDITDAVRPGQKHDLAVRVTARPLAGQSNAWWAAPDSLIQRKQIFRNKGIVGDVFLQSAPMRDRITDVQIVTSVRKHELLLRAEIDGLQAQSFILQADVFDGRQKVKTIRSKTFSTADLTDGAISLSDHWNDPKLWDIDAPQNMYSVRVALLNQQNQILDQTLPITFGFREFWIDGKDFYLNGSPVHLRVLDSRNVMSGEADQASDAITELVCKRAKAYGFNTFISQNYGFQPGQTGYMESMYRATDSQGMLISFSLPHAGHFEWKLDDPEVAKRYATLTRYLIRHAQNHPSIVMYAMNHNAVSYKGANNPLKLDGIYDYDSLPDADPVRVNKRRQAEGIAAAMARKIDPTRPVYHHSSGNLGQMITTNCYLNWVSPQERGDWISTWAKQGVKPLFFVEYGLPHIANWSSFRGPGFIWSTAGQQWSRDAEYAAAYLGLSAYERNEEQTKLLKERIASQRKGKVYWQTLIKPALKSQWRNYHDVQALFAKIVFQDYRAQGLSAILPWDQDYFWTRTSNVWASKPWPDALKNLQRPGIVPDVQTPGWYYLYEPDEKLWEETEIARVVKQWMAPVIAYIAGPDGDVTRRACNFTPGGVVARQVLVINDRRRVISGRVRWQLRGHPEIFGESDFNIAAGKTWGVPISIRLNRDLQIGAHVIDAVCQLSDGTVLEDHFTFNVIEPPAEIKLKSRIVVLDPVGETSALLRSMNISFTRATSVAMLPDPTDIRSQCDLLIIGRKALDHYKQIPQLDAVKDGLNVLFFEQSARALQNLMGLRTQEIGMRNLWTRVADHPIMNGISDDMLHDWQGSSSLYEPFTPSLPAAEQGYQPEFNWAGTPQPRAWRGGNRGNVASVLIEKPAIGDFEPLIDGAFDLRYSPLIVHTVGKGRAVFCQLDVTARTHEEPVCRTIVMNIIKYIDSNMQNHSRPVYVLGGPETIRLLEDLYIFAEKYDQQPLSGAILVVGSGIKIDPKMVENIEENDCRVLALGLNSEEVQALSQGKLKAALQERLSEPLKSTDQSLLRGITSAELLWNTMPQFFALQGDGHPALRILRQGKSTAVYCQVTPVLFGDQERIDTRDSYRRTIYLIDHLLINMGAQSRVNLFPLRNKEPAGDEWKQGLYRQIPNEVDDPYRFYGW